MIRDPHVVRIEAFNDRGDHCGSAYLESDGTWTGYCGPARESVTHINLTQEQAEQWLKDRGGRWLKPYGIGLLQRIWLPD